MIHNKINVIRPGCPQPSLALEVQNRGFKHQSFIHLPAYGILDRQLEEGSFGHVYYTPNRAQKIDMHYIDMYCIDIYCI